MPMRSSTAAGFFKMLEMKLTIAEQTESNVPVLKTTVVEDPNVLFRSLLIAWSLMYFFTVLIVVFSAVAIPENMLEKTCAKSVPRSRKSMSVTTPRAKAFSSPLGSGIGKNLERAST